MEIHNWISNNFVEIFGAVAGILYVFLEVRQNIWLWPVGIFTSAVYIWVFFSGKLYADMGLQGYYLCISVVGWYWWIKGAGLRAQGSGRRAQGAGQALPLESLSRDSGREAGGVPSTDNKKSFPVTRIGLRTGIILSLVFIVLYAFMWLILDRFTDSPVPVWDSFITSLSIIATWMLVRKIYEHWYLWIVVNIAAALLFYSRGLYPTVVLYIVYCAMSFAGLSEWKKSIQK